MMNIKSIRAISDRITILLFILLVVSSSGSQANNLPPDAKDYPVISLALASNAPQGKKIYLAGAKNEYLSLRFRIDNADLAAFDAKVVGNLPANALTFQFYQIVQAPRHSQGSYQADALVPLEAKWNDLGLPLEIWLTVKISASAPKGTHNFTILVTNKQKSYQQPVELKIWNFALPDDLPIPIMAGLYPNKEWFRRYGVNTPEQHEEVLKEYYRSMRQYKINSTLWIYPLSYEKVIAGAKIEELPRYHQMSNYVLNELNYRYFCLPLLPGARFLDQPNNDFLAKAKKYYPALADYVRRHHWESRAMIYFWDEPKPQEYQNFVKAYGYVKGLAPSLRTLTAGGGVEDQYLKPSPELTKVVNVWVTYAKRYNPEKADEFRKMGQEVWLYANKLHGIDQPVAHQRLLGWWLYNYKFTGYLFWGMNCWRGDPWKDVAGRVDAFRRGTFYYPNPNTGKPLPTTRLEAVRRGLQDYQYLMLLEKAHEKGLVDSKKMEAIREQVRVFSRDINALNPKVSMADLEKLRIQMGEILDLKE